MTFVFYDCPTGKPKDKSPDKVSAQHSNNVRLQDTEQSAIKRSHKQLPSAYYCKIGLLWPELSLSGWNAILKSHAGACDSAFRARAAMNFRFGFVGSGESI